MRYAEIVLGIILKVTGEPDDGKLSRPVRRGADGKVPLGNSPAAYPTTHIAGEEALIHYKFQTTDDPSMPRLMAGYIMRAIGHHGLPIYSSVIYLRRNAGRRDPGRYIQDLPGYDILVEYRVIRLSEIEGQDILDGGSSGLFPFVPLMKRPAGMDSEAWLRHCVDATNALPVDESIKVDILGRLMILSGLEYDSTLINRILSQEGLMDAIMRESSFAQYIK